MYGRDTCMRLASSVCDTPSSFIRSRMRRRNAEPILSIAVIPFNQPSRHPQFLQPSLLTSRRTDLDPALSHPRPDIIFHLRHSILPLSTSFAPRYLHIYWHPIMRRNVICLDQPHKSMNSTCDRGLKTRTQSKTIHRTFKDAIPSSTTRMPQMA